MVSTGPNPDQLYIAKYSGGKSLPIPGEAGTQSTKAFDHTADPRQTSLTELPRTGSKTRSKLSTRAFEALAYGLGRAWPSALAEKSADVASHKGIRSRF